MATVWISFLLTAAVLAIGAWAALRVKVEGASWLRAVGGFLAAMAVGTAGFPALRRSSGSWTRGRGSEATWDSSPRSRSS